MVGSTSVEQILRNASKCQEVIWSNSKRDGNTLLEDNKHIFMTWECKYFFVYNSMFLGSVLGPLNLHFLLDLDEFVDNVFLLSVVQWKEKTQRQPYCYEWWWGFKELHLLLSKYISLQVRIYNKHIPHVWLSAGSSQLTTIIVSKITVVSSAGC